MTLYSGVMGQWLKGNGMYLELIQHAVYYSHNYLIPIVAITVKRENSLKCNFACMYDVSHNF